MAKLIDAVADLKRLVARREAANLEFNNLENELENLEFQIENLKSDMIAQVQNEELD